MTVKCLILWFVKTTPVSHKAWGSLWSRWHHRVVVWCVFSTCSIMEHLCLMRTGKLAYLMLTFSSFCFMYLMYGILFILLPYGIAIISSDFPVHMRLSRSTVLNRSSFFSTLDAHAAAVCWVKREILQPEKANHEVICLFFLIHLLEVERISREEESYLCRLLVNAACVGGTRPAGLPFGSVGL